MIIALIDMINNHLIWVIMKKKSLPKKKSNNEDKVFMLVSPTGYWNPFVLAHGLRKKNVTSQVSTYMLMEKHIHK